MSRPHDVPCSHIHLSGPDAPPPPNAKVDNAWRRGSTWFELTENGWVEVPDGHIRITHGHSDEHEETTAHLDKNSFKVDENTEWWRWDGEEWQPSSSDEVISFDTDA